MKNPRFIFSGFLILFFLFQSARVSAQTNQDGLTLTNGPIIGKSGSEFIETMIGKDETGYYYSVRGSNNNVYLEHLNTKLQNDLEKMIDHKAAESLDFFAMLKGNMYCFFTDRGKESEFSISSQKVNNKTLELSDVPKLISTSQNYSIVNSFGPGYFSRRISEDESFMLLYSNVSHNPHTSALNKQSENETTIIHLTVFDSEMGKAWDREIEFAGNPSKFSVSQITIDNKGDVELLTSESSVIHFRKYSSDKSEDIDQEINLNKEHKYITDLKLANKPNGDIIIAGLYSDTGYYVHGAFYTLVSSKEHQVVSETIYPFRSDFIEEYEPLFDHNFAIKMKGKPHKPGFLYLTVNSLLIKENGELTLIAQQYLQFDKASGGVSSNPEYSVEHQYYYDDLILVNFDKQGTGTWETKIPKHQYTVNDMAAHSSFCFVSKANKIYILFNDNPANYPDKGQKREEYTNHGEYSVILTVINPDGEHSSSELEIAPENDLTICPSKIFISPSHELVILSTEPKDYEFGRITLE